MLSRSCGDAACARRWSRSVRRSPPLASSRSAVRSERLTNRRVSRASSSAPRSAVAGSISAAIPNDVRGRPLSLMRAAVTMGTSMSKVSKLRNQRVPGIIPAASNPSNSSDMPMQLAGGMRGEGLQFIQTIISASRSRISQMPFSMQSGTRAAGRQAGGDWHVCERLHAGLKKVRNIYAARRDQCALSVKTLAKAPANRAIRCRGLEGK